MLISRIYLYLIVIGLIASILGGAFWYYKDSQARIAQLTENNANLKVSVQAKDAAIDELSIQAEINAENNRKLQQQLQQAEKYADELRQTLQRHNLTELARKKPGLIEKKINDASNKIIDTLINDTTN